MMVSAQNDPRRAGTIWATNLDQPLPRIVPLMPTEFRRLGQESAALLAGVMQGASLDEVLRRFSAGGQCYTAWVGQQLAAYGWVSFHEEYVGEFNLRIHLLQGEAYIWDCFTLPAFRRQGLYSSLLSHTLGELRNDGLCRAWIGADLDNLASQLGIARAGFQAIADMVVARVFAMRLVWVQGREGAPEGAVAEARRAFLDNRDAVWLKAVEILKNSAHVGEAAGSTTAPSHAADRPVGADRRSPS